MMINTNNMEQLIRNFYSAFQNRDAQKMTECYHKDIIFSDPAFGTLNSDEVAIMWKMLCRGSKDLLIDFTIKTVNEKSAKVQWEAFYTYGKTHRKIHNKVRTSFEFKDNKIVRHQDKFSLWKWARQAMGTNGLLIGWTSFFKKRLQKQGREMLQRFLAKKKK